MTAPSTLSDNLLDRLNSMRQSGRYQRRDSIEWEKIKRECEQLLRSAPADGWSALAMLHAAAGDVAQMERCFQNASLLDAHPAVLANRMAAYEHLGLFSEARAIFLRIGTPSSRDFAFAPQAGIDIGSFQSVVEFAAEAKKLGLPMNQDDLNAASEAATILARAGVSDDDVARHLDAAGSVLRRAGMFSAKAADIYATCIPDIFSGVAMAVNVNCDEDELSALNAALANEETARHINKNSVFDVVFAIA